ncbi:O-antigen ligase family protein [Xanthobacter tagetidis]|nr:O-antigen ligase family protein [Xanthobacter tagetidis]MBB6307560.1 hypothetical protein [Xanthobacter tagetidis]
MDAHNLLGAAAPQRNYPLTVAFFVLLVTFLIAFPKGGARVGDVPVTIGYVVLGIATGLSYFRFLMNLNSLPPKSITAWTATLPFQFIVGMTFLTLGVRSNSTTLALTILTTFIFMPNAFLVFLSLSVSRIDPAFIKKCLAFAIRFVCIFGVVIFVAKTFFGLKIEIPFLTVNLNDIDSLETKNNTRGSLYKMISTYNNGNIFGVCLGLMLPIYYFIEKKKEFFFLALICMLLTLSRTAWASLILALMAIAWVESLRPSRILALGAIGLLFVAALPFVLELMGRDTSFLVDSRLGGRATQIEYFDTFKLEPQEPVGSIYEVVYASIYRNYGLFGLATFLVYLAGPIIVVLLGPGRRRTFNRACIAGLGVYIGTAASDGAILLIPTMALYFFIAVLALEVEDPDDDQVAAPPARVAPEKLPTRYSGQWRRPNKLRS